MHKVIPFGGACPSTVFQQLQKASWSTKRLVHEPFWKGLVLYKHPRIREDQRQQTDMTLQFLKTEQWKYREMAQLSVSHLKMMGYAHGKEDNRNLFIFQERALPNPPRETDDYGALLFDVMNRLYSWECLSQNLPSLFLTTAKLTDRKKLDMMDPMGYRTYVRYEFPHVPSVLAAAESTTVTKVTPDLKSLLWNKFDYPCLPGMIKPDSELPCPFIKVV